jgi:hypothetical protein
MEYKLTRTCKGCKNVDLTILTKIEAAFELYDSNVIWKTPCSKCGSENCESIGCNTPTLDKELLDIWGNDSELFLMEQDQELLLAEYDYFPMLLKAIDESKYLKTKINVLIEAICILLYDNIVAPEEYSKKENKEREIIAKKVRPELIKRRNRIMEAGYSVMDYIQEIVYPQIGIKKRA